MLDPKKVEEGLDSIINISNKIQENWKPILFTSAVMVAISVPYGLYENRDYYLPIVYRRLTKDTSAPKLLTPWSVVPPEEHPELWVCDKWGCKPDEAKQEKVRETLFRIQSDISSDRVAFMVYSESYRRLVMETKTLGIEPLRQELWLVSLRQPGVAEGLIEHKKGLCHYLVIEELPEGSLLRMEAPLYGNKSLGTCPLDNNELIYHVKGYLRADFSNILNLEERQDMEEILQEGAEEIEQIIWDN